MAVRFGTLTPWAIGEQNQDGDRLYLPDWAADARTGAARWTEATPAVLQEAGDRLHAPFDTGGGSVPFGSLIVGVLDNRASAGSNWFEDVHVIPRSVELGNILTAQTIPFEVFNGYRREPKTFSSFTADAGGGVSTSGLPGLPVDIFQLDTVGFDVIVSTTGSPTIDGELVFVVGGETISVPITGSRIVMFPYQPEAPLTEALEFLTDILVRLDGTEQRVALRKNPRQVFTLRVFADNDRERQRISNLLFDWQDRVFGLPIRTEATVLTADVTTGDTVISVESTANADYRIGGLAIVLASDGTFDALNVTAITATTLEFDSEITHDYDAADHSILVAPLRTTFIEEVVSRSKQKANSEAFDVTLRVIDNDANLASVSGWTAHPGDSKVILDGTVDDIRVNRTRAPTAEAMRRRLSIIDSGSGRFTQVSPWDRGREEMPLEIWVGSRDRLWVVRRLLHALRGQQVSFYLPTAFRDLTPSLGVTSGGSTLQVVNSGYAQFNGDRMPRNLIRLTTTAGVEYVAAVVSATEIDADDESLAVTVLLKDGAAAGPNWPDTVALGAIARVDFVQKVRLSSDLATITHIDAAGQARITLNTTTVLE